MDQLEAVLTVIDGLIDNNPGWADKFRKLKTHVQNQFRARYSTRMGLNTMANIIIVAAQEPGKLLQLYPWIVSHPAVRKRIKKNALYRRLNQNHFTALINSTAEETLTINMGRVFRLGEAKGIPELILYEILQPKFFEESFIEQNQNRTRERDNQNEEISPGDMMVVATSHQLEELSLGTIVQGMFHSN